MSDSQRHQHQHLKFDFVLTRKGGKNNSLTNGNQIINANDRMNWRVKGFIAQFLRQLGHDKSVDVSYSPNNPLFSPENPCIVSILVLAPTRRRFDAPNLYPTIKPLIDGMTDAGVWSDDNNRVIKSMTFSTSEQLSGSRDYMISIIIDNFNER